MERNNITFELEVAAEYFVDDRFFETAKSNGEMLSFGDQYVLVESSFLYKPLFFRIMSFRVDVKGIQSCTCASGTIPFSGR